MLARIFSSVLFPEPLRPTIPKNSPLRTSKETSVERAAARGSPGAENGWTARSLNVSIRCSGMRKTFSRSRTSITDGAVAHRPPRRPPRLRSGPAVRAHGVSTCRAARRSSPSPAALNESLPVARASRRERPRPARPRRRLARPPAPRPPTTPSIVGSAAIRFADSASSAAAVLVSKVFVTVSSPAEAISIGTRLGCGVNISDRPTSWPASMLAVGGLCAAARAPRDASRAAARSGCGPRPSRPRRTPTPVRRSRARSPRTSAISPSSNMLRFACGSARA